MTLPPVSRPASLPIFQLGHPSLRQGVTAVTNVTDPTLQELVAQLLQTMQQGNSVGIAAPQVGINLAIIIVASRPTPRYPHAPVMEPTVMVNPQILHHHPTQTTDWEGCLSVPNQRGLVPRYTGVTVCYTDLAGVCHQQELEGFVARIFQHEYDHLQGLIFLDRVESADHVISEADYLVMLGSGLSASNESSS